MTQDSRLTTAQTHQLSAVSYQQSDPLRVYTSLELILKVKPET